MFSFRNKKNPANEKVLIDRLLPNDTIERFIKPELSRYIISIDKQKLDKTDEIELFINSFTKSRALNTYRYLYLYMIEPHDNTFVMSTVYDKFNDEIYAASDKLYTFRYNDELQSININDKTKIQAFDFYRIGYNLYGLLLTKNLEKDRYDVYLWTNFLPKYIIHYDIIKNTLQKNIRILSKITLLKDLLGRPDMDYTSIPVAVRLYYTQEYGKVAVEYVFQVEQYKVILVTDYFTHELLEAFYVNPIEGINKIASVGG